LEEGTAVPDEKKVVTGYLDERGVPMRL